MNQQPFHKVFRDIRERCRFTDVQIAQHLGMLDSQEVRDWTDPNKQKVPSESQVRKLNELFRNDPNFADEDARHLLKAAGYSIRRTTLTNLPFSSTEELVRRVEQQDKVLDEIMRELKDSRLSPEKIDELEEKISELRNPSPIRPRITVLPPEIAMANVIGMERDMREMHWLQWQENLFFGVAGVLGGAVLGILIQLASSSAPPLIILGLLLLAGTVLLVWHLQSVRNRIDHVEQAIHNTIKEAQKEGAKPNVDSQYSSSE